MDRQFLDNIHRIPDRNTQSHAWMLYGLVVSFQPRLIVETGCAKGFTAAFLGAGAKAIGGKVLSIDAYADADDFHSQEGDMPVVRANLELVGVGDFVEQVKGVLPGALADLGQAGRLEGLGFIVFDDWHTYEQVKTEIEIAYPYLVPGGLIGGHDTNNEETPGVRQAWDEAIVKYHLAPIFSPNAAGYVICQKGQ
jgi:cephalosporin hydroxylase